MNGWLKGIQTKKKLEAIFDDRQKVTTNFKALHFYQGSVTPEQRKQFHQENSRRAFTVCRDALDEYAKREHASKSRQLDDVKRPCEIIEALMRLCQDIPDLMKQNWNQNALSELFIKFLHFSTNEEIRLQCVTFIFVVINVAKKDANRKYIDCLKFSCDYTPFCKEAPFEMYQKNFQKNLIVADDALPWTRQQKANKKHCLSMLSALLNLVKDAKDFEFWYLYMVKHIYPQLYYHCTCSHGKLVQQLHSDDHKYQVDKLENVEREGFGSCGPPSEIQSLMSEWLCCLLNNGSKNSIILSRKLYILYALEMMKNTMELPISSDTMTIYTMLKRVERWILGINLTEAFKDEMQSHLQQIIRHLFGLFHFENADFNGSALHKKLNIICYAIYLLRLIAGEPFVKCSPETWTCLIQGILRQVRYFKENKRLQSLTKTQADAIEERLVHPLLHCLFKAFVLMSISDSKTANSLLTQFRLKSAALIDYEPFVIQWREMVRNLTIELLAIISPKQEEKEKNYQFHQSSGGGTRGHGHHHPSVNRSINIVNESFEMDAADCYFGAEDRLKLLNIDVLEFRGLDEAFMIWDRVLHLLGSPAQNAHSTTRSVHLEGFCDALKIFLCALGIKERGAARKKKEEAIRLMKLKQNKTHKNSSNGHHHNQYAHGSHLGDRIGASSMGHMTGVRRIGSSIYSFAHSLISVPIDVSGIAMTGNLPDPIRNHLPLPPREQLPQSDTLMEIFGPWLFDECLDILVKCTYTEQVNRLGEFKMAFQCLAAIVLTDGEIALQPLYLSTFYRIIRLSFRMKISQKIRAMVLEECAKGCLFGKNLHGVNCLIPDFLNAMESVVGFEKTEGTKHKQHRYTAKRPKWSVAVFHEQEANDALTIAMSLICFAAHFESLDIVTFPNLEGNDDGKHDSNDGNGAKRKREAVEEEEEERVKFASISSRVCDVFFYLAHFDNLPLSIVNTVIWGNVLLIYDQVSSTKDLKIISLAIKAIVDSTTIDKLGMAQVATRAIESLSPICSQICEIDSEVVTEKLFRPFLQNMLQFVKKAANQDLRSRKDICAISTHQIYCCLEWMFRFPPSVLLHDALMSEYFRVLHESLCLQTKLPHKRSLQQNVADKHPLADLVLAAQTSKMMLFHYLGNFPLPHDSGAISSNAMDDYRGTQEGNVFLAYDSNVLITANDRILAHRAGPEPGVRFLLRDESGKFAWNFTPCSMESKPMDKDGDAVDTEFVPVMLPKPELHQMNKSQSAPKSTSSANSLSPTSNSPQALTTPPLSTSTPPPSSKKTHHVQPPSLSTTPITRRSPASSPNHHSSSTSSPSLRRNQPHHPLPMGYKKRFDKEQRERPSPPSSRAEGRKMMVTTTSTAAVVNGSNFNVNLTKTDEKLANVLEKKEFLMQKGSSNKIDGLKQVLNYVSRELTPPAGKVSKTRSYKKRIGPTTPGGTSSSNQQSISSSNSPSPKGGSSPQMIGSKKRTNSASGSFPSGHLTDKSRAKLAKKMAEQKKEEMDLHRRYQQQREDHLRVERATVNNGSGDGDESKKEIGTSSSSTKYGRIDRGVKLRDAVTGFDCSRFLLGHLGILTPGHVLGVKDSLFSDVTSDDVDLSKSGKSSIRRTRPMSPPGGSHAVNSGISTKPRTSAMMMMGGGSGSGGGGGRHHHSPKDRKRRSSSPQQERHRTSGHQYRLDPYLYSLDQNLLAMFGNGDKQFHRRTHLLDKSSLEREKHKIGVVYVGPDQDEQRLILANENGSASYRRFIDKLGWTVDLLRHEGFNGAMNASTTGRFAKYYCTATYEMAFHIATKMPTNHSDPQQTEKKKHIGNDQVNIIWTDSGRTYIIDTIYSHFNQAQIVIYPLNNGMYRIKIHRKSDVGEFGPLRNNMIIREHLLSILVRITSLYANRTIRYAASVYTRPFVERKKYLDEAIEKNSHRSHESILGAFFPYMAAPHSSSFSSTSFSTKASAHHSGLGSTSSSTTATATTRR